MRRWRTDWWEGRDGWGCCGGEKEMLAQAGVHYLINLTESVWQTDGSLLMWGAAAIYHVRRSSTPPLSTPVTPINTTVGEKDSPSPQLSARFMSQWRRNSEEETEPWLSLWRCSIMSWSRAVCGDSCCPWTGLTDHIQMSDGQVQRTNPRCDHTHTHTPCKV